MPTLVSSEEIIDSDTDIQLEKIASNNKHYRHSFLNKFSDVSIPVENISRFVKEC